MKKFGIAVLAMVLTASAAFADEPQPPEAVVVPEENVMPDYDWTFISFSFGTNLPEEAAQTAVYGVKIGIPASGGPAPVYGVEGSIFWAGSDTVGGVQASLIATDSQNLGGLQFSLVNFGVRVAGLQLGLFNFAEESAFQIGLLNHIKGSAVPWLPIVNCKF